MTEPRIRLSELELMIAIDQAMRESGILGSESQIGVQIYPKTREGLESFPELAHRYYVRGVIRMHDKIMSDAFVEGE